MKKAWEAALSHLTYGIYVLTTRYENEINGMIASWVSQVSYAPPQILAAVHPNRYSCHLIEKSGFFALHTLTKSQSDLLKRFKGPDPLSKFESLNWTSGSNGCPILNDCTAFMECKVTARLQPGNHILFIGEIINAQQNKQIDKNSILSTADYQGCYLGKN